MNKTFEQKISRFDGGMSEDKRIKDASKFSLTKHFDVFSYPHKIVPFNKTQVFAGEDKTLGIVKFLYASRNYPTDTSFKFYGLGRTVATTQAAVYMQDIGDSSWSTPNNNASSTGARNESVFFYYKGYIYMFKAGYLIRFDVTSAGAFGDSYQSITWTTLAEPVHHPSDDSAYFFANNVVYRLNDTTWDGAVLTLPVNLKIVSACSYGDYLAIGCVTKGSFDIRSIVYLWDRDSTLATLSQRIDFGEGDMKHLANLDNNLVAVMEFYLASDVSNKKGKTYIKIANGNTAKIVNEITLDASATGIDGSGSYANKSTRFIRDNILYFPARATLNGDERLGIWAVNGQGKATLAIVENEALCYEGIYAVANMWWFSHSLDYSTNHSVTDASYSTTVASIYESLIFNVGDSSKTKKLLGITVMTEPLPTAGQVVLKYRKNEETSWTTIFTEATDNSISHSAINIESSGATLPQFKELQLRVESTGGAVITGLKFKSEEIEKDSY